MVNFPTRTHLVSIRKLREDLSVFGGFSDHDSTIRSGLRVDDLVLLRLLASSDYVLH